LERIYPEQNEGLGRPVRVYRIQQALTEGAPREFYLLPIMLQAVFGLVLLIACGNVAGLLLARAAHRRRDIAVRVALGAGRHRLIRGLLVESTLLALAGGGAGLLLAVWLTSVLSLIVPAGALALIGARNVVLVCFGLVLALLTAAICGIVPAFKATRADVVGEIQQGTTSWTTGRLRLRNAFVVAQVAAALILLVLSSLFLRSLFRIGTLDPGFDLDHGLVAEIHVRPDRSTPEGAVQLAETAIDRVRNIPGVSAASVADIVPLGGDASATRFETEDRPDVRGARTYINTVSQGYFDTMGIALLRGRDFQATDRQGAPPVIIVSETFAREYFPQDDALGRRIRELGDRKNSYEIVGIVRDSKYRSISGPSEALLYYAFLQRPNVSSQLRALKVHVKTTGAPESALQTVRQTLAAIDTSAVVEVGTLRQATGSEASYRRIASLLLGTAGSLGLLLAMIGLYGVVAYVAASRTTEFGIRIALGATPRQILGRVLAQGSKLIVIGLIVGVTASLLVSFLLASLLAGLSPADPISFAGAATVLMVVGLLAILVPARRAARVDPLVALRYE
jgi:putative ABC transport system permease protein